jgi:RNA polymerase sigma-70 factor, ECF subfamily
VFAFVDALTRLAYAARLGDRAALDSLIDACYDEIRKLCAILVDDESADDLAQETFIRVVRALRRFRGESSARTWLLSIARNTCADELRSRARQRRRDRDLIAAGAADPAAVQDAAGQVALLDVISRLAPERREAFVLTQILRLTYEEAAQICGCPAGTVHSRVARAREDLIATLADRPQSGFDRAPSGRNATESGSDSQTPGT